MCIRDRVRTWNCAGPGTASQLPPEAPEGCVLRSVFLETLNLPTKAGLEGVRGREIANVRAVIRNPSIRNPRDPCLLENSR
eukprot:13137738-Alexandrium_andersonii.AAC.1